MPRRFHLFVALIALVLSGTSRAQDPATVRISFLLNFARYVEWPEMAIKPESPLRFCLAPGDSAMAGKFGELTIPPVQGHPVRTKQTARPTDIDDCQIIYLPADLPPIAWAKWQEVAIKSHILTVSDAPNFIDNGGMIGLVDVGGRYRFDVNLGNVRRTELKISSYLLKLARTVK